LGRVELMIVLDIVGAMIVANFVLSVITYTN